MRIVSRSWRAVFQARGTLNPMRVGLFTWSLVSHKMLRWLSGIFAAVAAIAALVKLQDAFVSDPPLTLAMVTALGGRARERGRRAAGMAGYFAVIYAASAVGVVKGSLGHVSGVWTTPREHDELRPEIGPLVPVGRLLQLAGSIVLVAGVVLFWTAPTILFAKVLFWTSIAVLAHVYFGYPTVLSLIRRVAGARCAANPSSRRVRVHRGQQRGVRNCRQDAEHAGARLPRRPIGSSRGFQTGRWTTPTTGARLRTAREAARILPRRGKIATINEGLKSVSSEIVVFSDANTFLEPGAIRALVQNFADEKVGAVSGDVALIGERASLGRSEDLYYRYERWMQRAESRPAR